MRCPECGEMENKVIDSRLTKEGDLIRRRRECLQCSARFTTHEQIETILPLVVKKDGRRENFDRQKILLGMQKACEKRPISINLLEEIVKKIEKMLQEKGETELPSREIGEMVMDGLHELDKVAYVRFASVYRSFKGIKEFMQELEELFEGKR